MFSNMFEIMGKKNYFKWKLILKFPKIVQRLSLLFERERNIDAFLEFRVGYKSN